MASIQEIVARRAPVASLSQASPNPNVGVGLISDAGSAGFRQVGQVRGISLDTATGFGQAMAADAQTVGMVGQAVGQIATAVDELNEASEKARLVSAGELAGKKIEEWNSISNETQREEFRVKQVEPALARINSQRKGLINIANNTRNAFVSEMGILGNAHKLNAAKSNGYMELAKLRIELDNAKDLGKGDVLAERYLSLSTSLITSGTLDPKEAYLLGKDTQAILKTSKENRLTAEYQRLIQNVPDNEINNVIEKLQKEGKGYVFSEDSEFRVLEKALDKSPVFRAKLLEDERTRRLKGLKAIVEEGEALESLAFQEERGQLEDVKSSIRANINDYKGGDVAGYTQELLNEYKGFSSTFRAKLRIDADKAINIRNTLRNTNLKEFIPKGRNILFALDESGNANIFQSYSNITDPQDKRKFLDNYLNSEKGASFRDLLIEHGIPLESAESAFLSIYNDPVSQTSVKNFNTPRDTITKNFLSKAEEIVEKNVVLNSIGIVDSKLIPNIMGRIREEVTRLKEANLNVADLKVALADFQKRFDANPRAVLELSSKESVVREKISGEPLNLEDIDKKFAALPKEKVEFVDTSMRRMINAEMISNPKLTEKVATGKVSNPQHLFSQLGNAVLKNPNVPKAKKAEMIKMAVTSAQKIHQVEVEKVEALRGKPQEISDVFPEGVRTPEQMQQFMNTHTQAEGFPLTKRDISDVPEAAPKENQENMFMGFARQLGKLVTGDANFELPDMDDIGKGLGSRDSRIDKQAATAKAMEFGGKNTKWNEDTQSWEPVKEATTPAAIPTEPTPEAGAVRIRSDSDVPTSSSDSRLSDTSQGAQGGGEQLDPQQDKVDKIHAMGMKAEAGEVTGNVFTVEDTVETDENGDPSGKVIGFGHNLLPLELANKEIKIGGVFVDITNGLSRQNAKALYYQDMAVRYAKLEKNLPDVDAPDVWSNLSEPQKVALTSAMYNNRFLLTLTGGAKSKARKFLEQGEYEKAASQTTDSQNIVRDSTRLKELVTQYRVPSHRKWISKSSLSDTEKLKMYRFLKARLNGGEIDEDRQPTLYRIITEGMAIENVE
jgi:GH24 family phage-related lysozyme (muramidase)